MPVQLSQRSLTFWFIPGMLVCVFVLSGLCLFFIRRQMSWEEERLRDLERFALDQTQQMFRQEVESLWTSAFRKFPEGVPQPASIHAWDSNLGPDTLGFCVDTSGMLIYPVYRIYANQGALRGGAHYIAESRILPGRQEGESSGSDSVPGVWASSSVEERFRQLLIKQKDRQRVEALCEELLKEDIATQIEDGLPLRLPVVTLFLEMNEATPDPTGREVSAVDTLLQAYAQSLIPMTPGSLNWLGRLREQCRSRSNQDLWIPRERMTARLVRQRQFAEKFLARIDLLVRKNLYNVSRFDLPVQYLTSDPSENPVLVAYRFLDRPPLGLLGLAIQLEGLCRQLENTVSRAAWLPADVVVKIGREPSKTVTERLVEQRILDPRAPQFLARVSPRDASGFERRSLYKNLLYLATVLVAIFSCILVLFFGDRALKEQERLSKLRTDFLTNVSHELRTPLTAIRLHAETLERQFLKTNQTVSTSVETIIEETDRLSRLISDMLEFTRLENDKRRFVWEVVDLVSVIQESLQLFSQQLAEEGFQVIVDLPGSLILQRADGTALKQTAVNLISNGIKYSTDRRYLGVRLRAETGQAIWEVEDHGVGIDPEEMPHVFEKFFRGSQLDPSVSGTGLGLTLCKAFVEAHGGNIRAESIQGEGSKFIINLPIGGEPGGSSLDFTEEELELEKAPKAS